MVVVDGPGCLVSILLTAATKGLKMFIYILNLNRGSFAAIVIGTFKQQTSISAMQDAV